jgi:hypothetical protein
MKRNVLIIAKRSINAEAMVRYWPKDKWNLYLYTFRKKEWFPGMSEQLGKNWIAFSKRKNSGIDESEPKADLKRHSPLKKNIRAKVKQIRKKIDMKYLKLYDQKLLSWALASLSQTETLYQETKPDVVISIYEPLAANLIARRMVARHNFPWIAYFRDHSTTYNELIRVPVLWHTQRLYDRWVHAPLNCLVGISSPFVDILNRFYKIPRSRSHVITGGFDDCYLPQGIRERCAKRRNNQAPRPNEPDDTEARLRISYIGSLYGHRVEPLCMVFDALQALLHRGVPCELILWLSNSWYFFPRSVQEKIEQLRTKGLAIVFGSTRIGHSEALEMQEAADVNLIVEGMRPPHSTAGTLTWKVFDLMMIAKPAIAVCAPTLPIGDYLREAGIGTDLSDTERIAGALIEIWKWKQGGICPDWYSPRGHAIEQYSFRSMAEKMSNLAGQF